MLGEGKKCATTFALMQQAWLTSGKLKLADDETTRSCFSSRRSTPSCAKATTDAIELAVCDSPQAAEKKMGARDSYHRLVFSKPNA